MPTMRPDGVETGPTSRDDTQGWVGTSLGPDHRYEIVDTIGRGGMGQVYLARDRNRDGKHVAIKVPLAALLTAPEFRQRFEREYKALIKLEHPRVCPILDTGQCEGVPFVVLKYLAGGDLHGAFLQAEPNHPPRTLENLFAWLAPIAQALDFIHVNNYVHRDIKPDNILFDEHGHAFLSDFGIVRVIDTERADGTLTELTQFGGFVGTPGYAAPELWTHGRADWRNDDPPSSRDPVDGRADIYSLGVVAYLYVTGRQPFPGKTLQQIRHAQLHAGIIPAHEINTAVSRGVSQVLDSALAVEPDQRPKTCAEMVEALREAGNLGSATSVRSGIARQVHSWWRWAAAGGLTLSVAWLLWTSRRVAPQVGVGKSTSTAAIQSAERAAHRGLIQSASPADHAPRPELASASAATSSKSVEEKHRETQREDRPSFPTKDAEPNDLDLVVSTEQLPVPTVRRAESHGDGDGAVSVDWVRENYQQKTEVVVLLLQTENVDPIGGRPDRPRSPDVEHPVGAFDSHAGGLPAARAAFAADVALGDRLSARASEREHAPAELHYQNAISYLANDEPESALRALNQAIQLDARPQYLAMRGKTCLLLGEHELAIQQCSQAIAADPRATFYFLRGQAYLENRAVRHALDDFDRAVGKCPGVAEFHALRGLAHLDDGQLQAALRDASRAVELQPRDERHYRLRAHVYRALSLDGQTPKVGESSYQDDAEQDESEAARLRRRHLGRSGPP